MKPWVWDISQIEEGRFDRAMKMTPILTEEDAAVFGGDSGTYRCTLSHCDCQDFQFRLRGKQPCKHILAYGAYVQAYDKAAVAHRFEGLRAVDLLAKAYGYYYLLDKPIISDQEYDRLKAQWADFLPSAPDAGQTQK